MPSHSRNHQADSAPHGSTPHSLRFSLTLILSLVLGVSLACALPGITDETPTAPTVTMAVQETPTARVQPTPTATLPPSPPQVVESDPAPGSTLPLNGPITLYFNQPMDQSSVEAAFSGADGKFKWLDDATLSFTPDKTFSPSSNVALKLGRSAAAANGLTLSQPVDFNFRTVGYLRLTQRLPEPGASEIDPSSAVVAAFNRPVVPLGADPGSLPPGFTLEPNADGQGSWLNTSTYIFYPQLALAGGTEYTVRLNPDLTGADGSPLKNEESWSFTTASPRLLSMAPEAQSEDVNLDSTIQMTFNQPMDAESVKAGFSLLDPNSEPLQGNFSWNEDFTVLTFTPSRLLRRDSAYRVLLNESARSSGGTPLKSEFSAVLNTVPELSVLGSEPSNGGLRKVYDGLAIHFDAPIRSKDVLDFITLLPNVPNLRDYLDEGRRTLQLYGDFVPDTDYTLIVSPNLPDEWGGRLGDEYFLSFHTLPLDPDLLVATGSDVLFLTPQDSSLTVQVTNIPQVDVSLSRLSLEDFEAMISPGGYDLRNTYQPDEQKNLITNIEGAEANRSQPVDLALTYGGESLDPGLYFSRFSYEGQDKLPSPTLIVVSNINLTFKLSATEALVWAVDLRDGSPVSDAPVGVYDEDGQLIASGRTNQDGIFQSSISAQENLYRTYYAVSGEPGQENFALALSYWSQGFDAWNFGLPTNYAPPSLKSYLYTDRPIYRPGQTVYFRAIARQAYNGRYSLPDQPDLALTLYDDYGNEVSKFDLPLSAFGTAHGSFDLPEDAAPGLYRIASDEADSSSVFFQVAEYRKPEIDLQVSFDSAQALASEALVATVNARYFFDAPAGNVPVKWSLFKDQTYFNLPGYQVGAADDNWLDVYPFMNVQPFGELVAEGEGQTGPDGLLKIDLPAQNGINRNKLTLEVTAQDESGLPVSGRASIFTNPDRFYIGVHPDDWVGQAETQTGFEVLAAGWDGNPAGEQALRAEFSKVVWEKAESPEGVPYGQSAFVPHYTPVASTDFVTGPDGIARLAFTPPEPGVYQLDVHAQPAAENQPAGDNQPVAENQPADEASGARTQILLWVGGPGQAVWPDLPNQRLRLTLDKDSYQPGDTAQVFIPNPLGEGALALISMERGALSRYQVVQLDQTGSNFSLALTAEDAPNIYLSVTLLKAGGSKPDFRQGYVNIPVEPVEQTLNVQLTSRPERTGPGGQVTFGLRVTDADGKPVEGEFSISVVDRAVLALADPNSQDIRPAFYGEQALGVRTGLDLAVYAHRLSFGAEGIGGGGGGEILQPPVVREKFPDTTYWNAEVDTDANGEAQVSLTLPDSLTTWQVDVRGLTKDTLVGQAEAQVVTTKDLIVRPVTPRFLVLGDHALLAAVVQNNTAADLNVDVSLDATGFTLDQNNLAVQQVSVPAGGRGRVAWWGSAQDVESIDLVFSAVSGGLEDAARPASGALPVLHYLAPQTFGTSGVLEEAGDLHELVSLPRSFDPAGGSLDVQLAPSLSAAMIPSLDSLEHFPCECTEQIVSRFLPNLEAYRVLQDFGVEAPTLKSRLDRTLPEGLSLLLNRQNEDGGWPWWQGGQSDPYLTAYVVYALARARDAGVQVDPASLQKGIEYLMAALPAPEMLKEPWQFDRLSFEIYALTQAGAGEVGAGALYKDRERLNPWAKALLALSLQAGDPGDDRAGTLLSDLESSALRSATGAHWEDHNPSFRNMSSPIFATAVVLYALGQNDPASPLVADAVRYLMAHRDAEGGWFSTYATSWSIMALAQVMQGTGELGGDFAFSALLNGVPIANGQAGGEAELTPVGADAPVADLRPDSSNDLVIHRDSGPGRLYYTAHLEVNRPVADVQPLQNGVSLSRRYYPAGKGCPEAGCKPIQGATAGDLVQVRLTLTISETAYYLVLEDYIPAGAEILDTSLKTSQQGAAAEYDPHRPFENGWGWWYFNKPQVFDDHIAWGADVLPPGVYEITYTLVTTHPGEYRVLPARAWEFYFPEVQGTSAGEIFRIDE